MNEKNKNTQDRITPIPLSQVQSWTAPMDWHSAFHTTGGELETFQSHKGQKPSQVSCYWKILNPSTRTLFLRCSSTETFLRPAILGLCTNCLFHSSSARDSRITIKWLWTFNKINTTNKPCSSQITYPSNYGIGSCNRRGRRFREAVHAIELMQIAWVWLDIEKRASKTM
jgi:hypothetical protein